MPSRSSRSSAPTLLSKRLLVSIIHPERDGPLAEIRPQPIEKSRPALAGQSFLNDPLAFELLEPAADRPARHAETGGQEPLRPPESIAAGPHEPDQGVFGRLPVSPALQVKKTFLLPAPRAGRLFAGVRLGGCLLL